MKYWLDTEFIEDGKTIDLISIGIVAEDGREYYAQPIRSDYQRASDWVARNVYPYLQHFDLAKHQRSCPQYLATGRCSEEDCPWRNSSYIQYEIRNFVDPDKHGKPEFWGYYADYDWVVLCQLFGTMMQLPKDWPMYCRDVKQLCDDLGNPKLPDQEDSEHHALADARWTKFAYEFLIKNG